MLRDRRNPEIGKDQDEDEDVIDAERVLDEVAGQEIERLFRPAQLPNDQIEEERKDDPDGAAPRRRPQAQFAVAQLELSKIDNDRDEHADVKRDPKPNTRRHRSATVSRRGAEGNRKRLVRRLFSRE